MDFTRLGTSYPVGDLLVFENCPFCSDKMTFRFLGKSSCECIGCGFFGFQDELEKAIKERGSNYIRMASQDGVPRGLINIGTYIPDKARKTYITTGFGEFDRLTNGLRTGWVTIITGKRGEGKSTFASQMALNAVNGGAKVCFYSGEMDTDMFQEWMLCQAAGANNVTESVGANGALMYNASTRVEGRIKQWLDGSLYLLDSSIAKFNEKENIFKHFLEARQILGCNLFFIDNLMSAHLTSSSGARDVNGLQGEFIGEICSFALTYNVHIVLVAHPRKTDDGDINDNVAGTSEITNRAANIIRVERSSEKIKIAYPSCKSVLSLSKNRGFGHQANLLFAFDFASRRYSCLSGRDTKVYSWEEME